MFARFIFIAFIATFQLSYIKAADITIDCIFQPDASPWTSITTQFPTCHLENDLKGDSVAVDAISGSTADLTKVQVFTAKAGRKISLLPSGLETVFPALVGIYVEETDLSLLDENVLKELTALKYLSVIRCQLGVIVKDTFKGNSQLELIDLTGNQILFVDEGVFTTLTSLKYLDLTEATCLIAEDTQAAKTPAEITTLKEAIKTNCADIDYLQIQITKTIKDYALSKESSESCEILMENDTCTADCELEQAEIDELKLKFNEQVNITLEYQADIIELNADILELQKTIKDLEENECDLSNGTCKYKVIRGLYACEANGITIKTSNDQTVVWNGTHNAGNNNDNVLSMSIKSQTTELLPLNIGTTFKNLINLSIIGSGLKSIKNGELKSMSKLEVLEITGNSIETIESGAFNELKTLKKIDISSNKIVTLPTKIFASLTILEILNLGDNLIKKINYDWIPTSNVIKECYLYGNQITPIDRNFIYRLRNADIIDLQNTGCNHSYNKITDPNLKFITFYSRIVTTC